MKLEFYKNKIGGLFTLLSGALLCLGLFNNCGRANDASHLAFLTPEEAKAHYSKSISVHYNKNLCKNLSLYECDVRSFGPELEDGESPVDLPCVALENGQQVCPDGLQYTYNTSKAVEDCIDCSEEDIEERYRTTEFLCYHKSVMMDGHYPIRDSGSSYEEAVKNTVATCADMVDGI